MGPLRPLWAQRRSATGDDGYNGQIGRYFHKADTMFKWVKNPFIPHSESETKAVEACNRLLGLMYGNYQQFNPFVLHCETCEYFQTFLFSMVHDTLYNVHEKKQTVLSPNHLEISLKYSVQIATDQKAKIDIKHNHTNLYTHIVC